MLGWGAIYNILGSMSLAALIMLFCFNTEKTTFIPFDDERPFYTFSERKLNQMPEVISRSKRISRYDSNTEKSYNDYRSNESDVSSQDHSSTNKVNAALLAGQRYE